MEMCPRLLMCLPNRNHMYRQKDGVNIVLFFFFVEILNCLSSVCSSHVTHTHTPINNWLFSCRWMCPSAGASCVAAGSSSRRSDASLTLRSARMRCHLSSFSGKPAFTRTSKGPLPTSKEKRTSVDAASRKGEYQDLLYIFNKVPS